MVPVNLIQLHALAVQLDLGVAPSQKVVASVQAQAADVAGLVHALPGKKGSGRKAASVRSGREM
jgi:hypothetical protein